MAWDKIVNTLPEVPEGQLPLLPIALGGVIPIAVIIFLLGQSKGGGTVNMDKVAGEVLNK